jgi:DNA ligase-1
LTLHGFAGEFARDLRDRGYEAWALSAQNQLELTLGTFRAVEAGVLATPKPGEGGSGRFSAPKA